jgi:hypothetical protein
MFVVVTVVACWLAYHLNWIRQRHSAISKGEVGLVVSGGPFTSHSQHPPPWRLRVLGEQAIFAEALVTAPDATDADLHRLRSLFPELDVERP